MGFLQNLNKPKPVRVPELEIDVWVKPVSIQKFMDLAKSKDDYMEVAINLILDHVIDVGTKEELLASSPLVINALIEAVKEGSGVADKQIDAKKKS